MNDWMEWPVDGWPEIVRYKREVLQEITGQMTAGFRAYSWGGVEVGGVLLGTREGDLFSITGHRPVDCEHAHGPSYELTAQDRDSMRKVVETARAGGLEPVGWYKSVSNRELAITEPDKKLWAELFPAGMLLILKRSKEGVSAGITFCRADGRIISGRRKLEADTIAPQRSEKIETDKPAVTELTSELEEQSKPAVPLPPQERVEQASAVAPITRAVEASPEKRVEPAAADLAEAITQAVEVLPEELIEPPSAVPPEEKITPAVPAPPEERIEPAVEVLGGEPINSAATSSPEERIEPSLAVPPEAPIKQAVEASPEELITPTELAPPEEWVDPTAEVASGERINSSVTSLPEERITPTSSAPPEERVDPTAEVSAGEAISASSTSLPEEGIESPVDASPGELIMPTASAQPEERVEPVAPPFAEEPIRPSGVVLADEPIETTDVAPPVERHPPVNAFALTPDPEFFYPSQQHREALSILEYGITHRKGLIMLVGDSGMGKTMVLECLTDRLRVAGIEYGFLFNSRLSRHELFELLADDFELKPSSTTKTSVLMALNDHLLRRAALGNTTALLIDDAQKLNAEVLEEIELLSNIETRKEKLLQMVMAARPEFESRLNRPELAGLRQRFALRRRLGPLNSAETAEYIRVRLERAGDVGAALPLPVEEIHRLSSGVPRMINAICGRLLERRGLNESDPHKALREVADELGLNAL